jgi:hypothetical protein
LKRDKTKASKHFQQLLDIAIWQITEARAELAVVATS